jgi:hypothetical protein
VRGKLGDFLGDGPQLLLVQAGVRTRFVKSGRAGSRPLRGRRRRSQEELINRYLRSRDIKEMTGNDREMTVRFREWRQRPVGNEYRAPVTERDCNAFHFRVTSSRERDDGDSGAPPGK